MSWVQLTFVDVLIEFAAVAHPPKGPKLIYSASAKRIKRRQVAIANTLNGNERARQQKRSRFLAERIAARRAS